MTVYVDQLASYGWKIRGHETQNCHMFTDELDLTELHKVAMAIGMKPEWFQDKDRAPHYDLTPSRRQAAIDAGVVVVDRRTAVGIWRKRRELVGDLL